MIKKNSKLYLLALLSVLFMSSCVSNNDEPPKVGPDESVPLTRENLQGSWELYFWEKNILKATTNFSVKYRFTETDGFKVGFGKQNGSGADDDFFEMNAFGMKTTSLGKYMIGNYEKDHPEKIWTEGPTTNLDQNGVFFKYRFERYTKNDDKKVVVDTFTHARIDDLFWNRFAYKDFATGAVNGVGHKTIDIRYYRNVERAPNYYPSGSDFAKTIITVEDLLGRWEFYEYTIRVDQHIITPPTETTNRYGEQILFRIEGSKQACYEYSKGEYPLANRAGEFKIVDDVVHMFFNVKDGDGQPKIEASKFWIKTKKKELIREYDIYRTIDNPEVEREEIGFYKRVADN